MSGNGDAPPEWADELGPEDGMLVLSNITKEFGGITAVDDLSFAVDEAEIVGLIGPNGAGKTTAFNCITGVYPPTEGTVWYKGENVTDLAPHEMVKRGMARTYQSFRPLDDRSVVQNIALSLVPDRLFSLAGLRGDTLKRAEGICELVGLADQMEMTPDELPHAGMLRLELGRALATNPDILLLDEPFAGLSEPEVDSVTDVLKRLRDDAGVTLIVVDHNMRGLFPLIDRAVVIRFGERIAEGTPEEIKTDPMVKKAYLGGGAK